MRPSPHPALRSLACALGALGVLVAVAPACTFDTRTREYRCDPGGDCPFGRVCVDGWCVEPAAGDAAAGDSSSPVDAVPGAADAPRPDAPAPACPDGNCGQLEDPVTCPADCSTCGSCSAGTCAESCGGPGAECSLDCAGASCTCLFDCTAAGDCAVKCDSGACTIDCTDADSCAKVRCLGGAACRIHCTGAGTCGFQQCTGGSGEVSCPDGLACNRDC